MLPLVLILSARSQNFSKLQPGKSVIDPYSNGLQIKLELDDKMVSVQKRLRDLRLVSHIHSLLVPY
jgi:hypothetical protein